MRVYYNKTLHALCLLLLILLLVQTASALLTSSHYDGYVYFDVPWGDGTLNGVIEFAVYDDRSEYESLTGLTAPGGGDYVYAYKIWNTLPTSDEAVAYFSILGLDESEITGFGYDDDGNAYGIEPADAYFDGDNGVWEWSIDNGFIQLGENSWLLVFSSNYDWVAGEYEIRGTEEGEFPEPGDGDEDVPEPSLVALFGLGSAALLRRRKR